MFEFSTIQFINKHQILDFTFRITQHSFLVLIHYLYHTNKAVIHSVGILNINRVNLYDFKIKP